MEIPVYLFTGFLESGKTTFIQESLEDSAFNIGERTLLLLCEQGEIEYEPERFFGKHVFPEILDGKDRLDPAYLADLRRTHKAERVIIEYNGMWPLDLLFSHMPEDWIIYQEVVFFDARSFLTMNRNMRQLVFDKLRTAELVVFNRCLRESLDKQAFHKIVRGANRKSMIIYEYGPDDAEPDTIQDPLPFCLDDPVVDIREDAYAEWYRDINEDPKKYDGKVLTIKGRTVTGEKVPRGSFVFGRHVMTCCEADIQFAGLLCKGPIDEPIGNGAWAKVKVKVKYEYNNLYGGKGPVLYLITREDAEPAKPEVATF